MTIPARYHAQQQENFLRVNFAWNTPGIAGGIQVGTLPAGARIVSERAYIDVAFNAGTTNVVAVGTTALGAQIMTGTDTAAGTTGAKRPTTGEAVTFPTDTPIFLSFTQTGTAATAGSGTIVLSFVPDSDVGGTYTPAN